MGSDVGQIFPTASLHRDHSILHALVFEKIESIIGVQWGQKNPNLRFQWETRLAEFPTDGWTGGLGFFWNH